MGLLGTGDFTLLRSSALVSCWKSSELVLLRDENSRFTVLLIRYDTQDGLYGVAWSELNDNHIASASGDGSIKLWDLAINVSELSTTYDRVY